MRVGPGTRFPIEWQYHRRDLPVEILREVEVWRLVRGRGRRQGLGASGDAGRAPQLRGEGRGGGAAHDAPDEAADAVARLKPGVVGRIRACAAAAAWCEVQVERLSRLAAARRSSGARFPARP